MNISITDIRCNLQVALLGAVTSNLRAVTVTLLEKKLVLNFYYENEPTENEIDLAQVASTDVLSGFTILISVEEQQIVLPQSESIPLKNKDLLVYHRYEGHFLDKTTTFFKNTTFATINMASQIALLGNVTSNLRAVLVDLIEKNLTFYFYYDEEISQEEVKLSEVVMHDAILCFEDLTGNVKRFVVPEPEKKSFLDNGSSVYWRYEEYLIDD